MKGEFSFRQYRQFRSFTGGLALIFAVLFLLFQYGSGLYSGEKSLILFFLCLFKIGDAFCDVYESELQRRGILYKAGQSMFLRTVFSVLALLIFLGTTKNLFLGAIAMNLAQLFSFLLFSYLPLRATEPLGEEKPLNKLALSKLWKEVFTLFLSVFLDFLCFFLPVNMRWIWSTVLPVPVFLIFYLCPETSFIFWQTLLFALPFRT